MQHFTAKELSKDVRRVGDAARVQPVSVSLDGEAHYVLMSAEEFARLKRRDRAAIAIEDLPETFRQALAEPYVNDEQRALDRLLDE